MNFKPIDEMSLRHLFSSSIGENILKLTYLGPVISPSNSIETSPDCLILDRRSSPYKKLRCEFKFTPSNYKDFEHNGTFDIAVIWKMQNGYELDKLKDDLYIHNGCNEIIALEDYKYFRDLPDYNSDTLRSIENFSEVEKMILKRDIISVFTLYVAVSIFPERFNTDKLYQLLKRKFASTRTFSSQGLSNLALAFKQTKPSLLLNKYNKVYSWNDEYDSSIYRPIIQQIITNNFNANLPSQVELDSVHA